MGNKKYFDMEELVIREQNHLEWRRTSISVDMIISTNIMFKTKKELIDKIIKLLENET